MAFAKLTVTVSLLSRRSFQCSRYFPRHLCSSTSELVRPPAVSGRPPNPVKVPNQTWIESLCSSLHNRHPNLYGFCVNDTTFVEDSLNKKLDDDLVKRNHKELLELLRAIKDQKANGDVESRCLDLFQAWAGNSSLGIAYLMAANKQFTSQEFLERVVKSLSSRLEELTREELVALWLCVFFTKKTWDVDSFFEYFDPDTFQAVWTKFLESETLTSAEVCCICIGIKQLQSFQISNTVLRETMYDFMVDVSEELQFCPPEERWEHNLAISLILGLLKNNNYVTRDTRKRIEWTFESFSNSAPYMTTATLVQVVYYGGLINLSDTRLVEELVRRIKSTDALKELSVRDIAHILRFLNSNQDEVSGEIDSEKVLDMILSELKMIGDHDCRIIDTRDILHCHSIMVNAFDRVHVDLISDVFKAINDMPTSVFDRLEKEGKAGLRDFGKQVTLAIHKKLFPRSFESSDVETEFSEYFAHDQKEFMRYAVAIDQALEVLYDQEIQAKIGRIDEAKCSTMLQMLQTPIPPAVIAPQMKSNNASKRQRLLVEVHKKLRDILDGENYVSMCHILPHFLQPDIVFGHVAGTPVSTPYDLRVETYKPKRAPEVGDWTVLSVEAVPNHNRRKQLEALGYRVIYLGSDRSATSKQKLNAVVATELTGRKHDDVVSRDPTI